MARIPVYQITVPEYHVKSQPDHTSIGSRIDDSLKKHFMGKRVAIRCLGTQEHKGKSVNDMVRIIRKLGTDRYNPKRKGDRYENVDGKHIDFFALDFTVKPNSRIMEQFVEPFYLWPPKFGRKPVRLDIAIVYDLSKLKRVLHMYEGRDDVKRDAFVFRDLENKRDALLGIIKIL